MPIISPLTCTGCGALQGTTKESDDEGPRGYKDISRLRDFPYSEYVPELPWLNRQEALAEPSSYPPMYPPQRQLGIKHELEANEAFMEKHFDDKLKVKRPVVFLLSDFGCGECACKRQGDCKHPRIVPIRSIQSKSFDDLSDKRSSGSRRRAAPSQHPIPIGTTVAPSVPSPSRSRSPNASPAAHAPQ